jgi:N-acetylglucosamine-6-phosphate deacetylase
MRGYDTMSDRAMKEASPLPFSVRGRLLLEQGLTPGALIVEAGRIAEVRLGRPADLGDLPAPSLEAEIVSPGLIDLQVNGAFGVEVGADPEALRVLSGRLPETGVTTFLPTLVSAGADDYRGAAAALEAAQGTPGARMLGLHLEGPFLSASRAGAHPPSPIAAAAATVDAVLDDLIARRALALMTVAPERAGALALIRRLRAAGVAVSLGHTDATFDETLAGIEAGATLVTHLYNAMRGFHHRAPGAVGAALVDDRVGVALIADGVHVQPAALNLALRAKGARGIALVTDAVAAAGEPPGEFHLSGAPVFSDGRAVRLADGTLAGSALTLDRAVRFMVSHGGATVHEALIMATATPARILGPRAAHLGQLAPGSPADLVLWDSSLQVEATFVAGRRCPAA